MARFLFLFLLLLISCKTETKKTEKGERVVKVSLWEVREENVDITLPYKGFVSAQRDIKLFSEVSGKIVKLLKLEGERVKKGEALAVIDTSAIRKEIERIKESIRELEESYKLQRKITERRKRLYERELISLEDYERAQTKLNEIKHKIEALKRELEAKKILYRKHFIKAPFKGIIGERYVNVGDYVSPQKPLFRIISYEPLEFVFKMPEGKASLRKGQELEVEIEGRLIKGFISYISPHLDENRLLTVKLRINEKVSPGTFGYAYVPLKSLKAFKVPEDAVILRGSEKVVWKVEGVRAYPVKVEIVKGVEGYLYVLGDLKEGDKIVVENANLLREGARVSVK
ncbi:efflux RND transporter periplasmic adaptor subunit [Aquifex pyrophilus]